MKTNLTPLGHARVYRDPRTGQLVVDTDTLRRSSFAGDDFAGRYDDDDDFEGYDDDLDGEEDDDFGFLRRDPQRRQGRRRRRLGRQRDRLEDRVERKTDRLDRKEARIDADEPQVASRAPTGWGATAVSDADRLDQAGAVALKIRLQHDFRARDVTFTGSAPGALVHSIFFGDRAVWSSSDGIDSAVFAANGLLRGLLEGQSLRAGLDIIINGSLPGPGVFTATLIGTKPVSGGC